MTPDASPFRPGGQYFAPLIGVIAVAIVAGVASFFFFGGQAPVEEPAPVVVETPPPPQPPPPAVVAEEPVVLPSLDESDSFVRDLVAALTSHPAFAAWLIPDELIRTFVLLIENVADGTNPAERLTPMRPPSASVRRARRRSWASTQSATPATTLTRRSWRRSTRLARPSSIAVSTR